MRQVARRGILTAVATGSVLASTAGYAYASTDAQGLAANSAGVGSGNSVQVPVDAPVNLCGNTVDVIGLLNPAFGNNCANASASHQGGSSHTWGGGPVSGTPSGGTAGTTTGTPGMPGVPGMPGGGGSGVGGVNNGGTGQWPGTPGMPSMPGMPSVGGGGGGNTGGTGGGGGWPTAGSGATGVSQGSPGVGSGNTAQTPVDVPVNACGNTVDVIGLGNSAMGNDCTNQEAPAPAPAHNPPPPSAPVIAPPAVTPPLAAPPVVGAAHTPAPQVVTPAAAKAGPAVSQLAFTGVDGLGLIAPAGLALLIGGGVLYRRSRMAA